MGFLLNQLLSESAAKYPEKAAVWAQKRILTYHEVDEQSNQLANFLVSRGVRKGDRIGIYFTKAVESVAAMLGALKAGAVYVPLDPASPVDRIEYILGNCGIKGLVTTSERLKSLSPAARQGMAFSVLVEGSVEGNPEAISWNALGQFPSDRGPEVQMTTTDLAYILYTSGSTGRPKGVMISHQNALTFVEWCAETFNIQSDDHLSNHAPLHFDLSVFDVYNSLKAGATVYLVPDEVLPFPAGLAGFIESQGISVWYSVPSALVYLILHGNLRSRKLDRLRLILFAGEVFPMKYLRQLAEQLPSVELYNLYGPTETNVCTYYRVDRSTLSGLEHLPIGKACANTEVFAVTDRDELAKEWETGELYVRGPGVTCGYWADVEKTRKSVVANRFQPNFEEKAYRTGDIVMLSEDGNYDFIGRRDSMIKSRGYRIELGEIEAALLSHSGVREAVALAIPDEEIGARIRAVVSPHNGNELTAAELLRHCAAKVPKYMVPEAIEVREDLPKTSTGKLDRVRLASEVNQSSQLAS